MREGNVRSEGESTQDEGLILEEGVAEGKIGALGEVIAFWLGR